MISRSSSIYRNHKGSGRRRNSRTSIPAGRSIGLIYRFFPGCAAALLVLFFAAGPLTSFFSGGATSVQADQQLSEIQYKVIEIHKGDTLWSIASENISPGFSDIYSYIKEIKTCNQLESNSITSGSYLMIPYYRTESVDYAAAD